MIYILHIEEGENAGSLSFAALVNLKSQLIQLCWNHTDVRILKSLLFLQTLIVKL